MVLPAYMATYVLQWIVLSGSVEASTQAVAPVLGLHSVEDLVRTVRPHLSSELVRQVGCVYRFVEKGPDDTSRTFYLDLKHGG